MRTFTFFYLKFQYALYKNVNVFLDNSYFKKTYILFLIKQYYRLKSIFIDFI